MVNVNKMNKDGLTWDENKTKSLDARRNISCTELYDSVEIYFLWHVVLFVSIRICTMPCSTLFSESSQQKMLMKKGKMEIRLYMSTDLWSVSI